MQCAPEAIAGTSLLWLQLFIFSAHPKEFLLLLTQSWKRLTHILFFTAGIVARSTSACTAVVCP